MAEELGAGVLQTKVTNSGGFTYVGRSLPGTLESAEKWQAYRIDADGGVMLADGNDRFDNVATDLTALSYSYS